jgi:hypothetical protein
MVNALFLLLAAGALLAAVAWWQAAWRKAKVDADPELLYWLLASSGAGPERRAGAERQLGWCGEDRQAG